MGLHLFGAARRPQAKMSRFMWPTVSLSISEGKAFLVCKILVILIEQSP